MAAPGGTIVLKYLKKLLRNILIGGVIVVAPLVILYIVFDIVFDLIVGLIRPLSSVLSSSIGLNITLADLLSIILILVICFLIGLLVMTRVGRFFHRQIENRFLKRIPGYGITKDVVLQFSGEKEVPFSKVVLFSPFNNDIMQTGLITDSHPEVGYLTVFAPTGPNPTTGMIYHVPAKDVFRVNVKAEIAIKSVIGCGAGSGDMFKDYSTRYGKVTKA